MTFISDSNDSRIFKGNICLVFSAPWCGPCKMLKPVLEKVATETYTLYGVDVDDAQELASKFNVRSVPSGVALVDGEVVNIMQGVSALQPNKIEESFR